MNATTSQTLVINGGSSSIKFAFYQLDTGLQRGAQGRLERIGLKGTNLTFTDNTGSEIESIPFSAPEHSSTAAHFIDWLKEQDGMPSVEAVGHRGYTA
jgi:acetate kinase